MRTPLFALAAAASALAFASPAAAQYYPYPPAPQGPAYGYNNPYNHGQIRNLMVRIDRLQRDAMRFDRQGRLSRRDAANIHHAAEDIRRRLLQASYNGLNRRERVAIGQRIERLRQHMHREMQQYRGHDRRWDRDYDRAHDRWHDRNDRRWDRDDDDDDDDRRHRRHRDRDDD